jgi:MFS family permease
MKINYGKVLMWSAIIVSMPRWAGAFISADVSDIPNWVNEALHYGNLLAGFGMGFLEVLAAAYMLDAWGKMKPKASWNAKSYDHKWKILTGFIVGLFVLMPLILAPYIVSRMTAVTIGQALQYSIVQYVWSIAVVLSPAFIVGGVSVASGELIENETENKPAKATKKAQPVAQPAQPKTQPDSNHLPEVGNLEGNRLTVYQLYKHNPSATQQEIANKVGISRQMVSKYKKELNGYLK